MDGWLGHKRGHNMSNRHGFWPLFMSVRFRFAAEVEVKLKVAFSVNQVKVKQPNGSSS